LCLVAVTLYNIPALHDRLAWRVDTLRVRVLRALKPPQQQLFVPQGQSTVSVQASSTPALSPTATPVLLVSTGTPSPSPTPTLTPTPIPGQVALSGAVHEYQAFNNCGPATLAMALSYWGWKGDQRDTRLALRPNFTKVDDKNVNPSEMVAFTEQSAGLKALASPGGDLETLKRFLAAGFPAIIEIGIQQHPKDWMGHYLLITGYDDERARFTSQDSLVGADMPVTYEQIEQGWRAFNHVYLVVYPLERESEVLSILGAQADVADRINFAAEKARQETAQLLGRDLFFAWYNLGSNLTAVGDFSGAAQAFDQAFAVYAAIPEDDRPWRVLWYQAGPYEAYFNVGRYQDVITLGNQALDSAGGPLLEESFYWLGRAREATGDLEKAIYDYRQAIAINPDSTPALHELERLGVPVS
jgi:tetratricopeptide (TPR) repeat protein